MRVDVFVHGDDQKALERIERKIDQVLGKEGNLMALVDDVLAEAQRGTTVGQSVIALVQTLVANSGGDPVKLQAALDAMKANDDAVDAAVLANTPQAPPPAPAPAP